MHRNALDGGWNLSRISQLFNPLFTLQMTRGYRTGIKSRDVLYVVVVPCHGRKKSDVGVRGGRNLREDESVVPRRC